MKRALIAILAIIGCLHPLFAQQEARQLFFEGENRFANEAYSAALDRYSELIESYPESRYVPDAQFRRALAHYRLGEYREALILLDRVERRFRSTQFLEGVPFWKGLSHYHLAEFDQAEGELTRFVENAGDGDRRIYQAYLYRGIIRSRLDRPTPATADLRRAASSEEPEIAGYAWALWAELNYQREAYATLAETYEELQWSSEDLGPWAEEVFFYIADAYYQVGELDAAEALLSAISGNVEDRDLTAAVYQRRFSIAQEQNREVRPILQEAEERLAGAVSVLQRFWLQVGVQHYRADSLDLAEFYLRRVWELRDRTEISGAAPLYLSRILVADDELDAATAILEETWSRGLEPREDIALALAGFYIERRQYSQAESLLQGLLDGSPEKESEVRYRLAFVQFSQGAVNRALETIEETFSQGRAGSYSAELLRLRSRALGSLDRDREALQVIREYLALRPDDSQGRFEYMTLLFRLGEYQRLIEELDQRGDSIDSRDAAYLRGLAQVGLGRYEAAVATLSGLEGSPTLEPYREYYLAWAQYRLGRNREALNNFDRISRERVSPFAARSAYLGGWSAYAVGDYGRAAELLRRVSSFDVTMRTQEDAWRLLAESYRAAGEPAEALSVYRTIMAEAERGTVIAEAWLSYALLLDELGREEESLAELSSLNSQFSGTPQGERALFEAGRLLAGRGSYEAARERFLEYRRRYPRGEYADAALYREGVVLLAQEQAAGAILVWERFLEEYTESPLAYEVKRSLAPLYEERGELRRAYNLYGELLAAYPDRAEEDDLQRRREELSLRLQGLSDREASLWAQIQSLSSGSAERASAILELARIVVYEGGGRGPRRELLIGYLRDLAQSDNPEAPRASFLLGEYFAGEQRYREAIDAYLATADEASADLTARALFRAAQMYGARGDRASVRTVVERIEEEFPDSTWAAEGRRLLGGER